MVLQKKFWSKNRKYFFKHLYSYFKISMHLRIKTRIKINGVESSCVQKKKKNVWVFAFFMIHKSHMNLWLIYLYRFSSNIHLETKTGEKKERFIVVTKISGDDDLKKKELERHTSEMVTFRNNHFVFKFIF